MCRTRSFASRLEGSPGLGVEGSPSAGEECQPGSDVSAALISVSSIGVRSAEEAAGLGLDELLIARFVR